MIPAKITAKQLIPQAGASQTAGRARGMGGQHAKVTVKTGILQYFKYSRKMHALKSASSASSTAQKIPTLGARTRVKNALQAARKELLSDASRTAWTAKVHARKGVGITH